MRIFSLWFLALVAVSLHAKTDCENDILVQRQMLVSNLRNTSSFAPSTLEVRGRRYMLIRELGKSTSTVHLALDPEGHKVIIKIYDLQTHGHGSRQHMLFAREFVVTKFLRSRRFPVPRILNYEVLPGILVKEYSEGLLPWELKSQAEAFGIQTEEFDALNSMLSEQTAKLEALNQDFAHWILGNFASALPRELARMTTDVHIRPKKIDAREINFIYNFEREKWILFDP